MMNALARCVVGVLLCVIPLCGGCAFGHKYNYHDVVPTLEATGTGQLEVATHDQRPYVVSGGTEPTFVGLSRSGFGVPYPVYTQSDRPLAEDMTQVICTALTKKGFQCVPIIVAANASPSEVRRKLQERTSTLAILLVFNEWKSDTHVDTTLAYHATLSILDPRGTIMAETQIQGRDIVGSNFWDPIGVAYTAVPQTFKKKLEGLLNHPSVVTALQSVNRS